jgi:hypothetical protein
MVVMVSLPPPGARTDVHCVSVTPPQSTLSGSSTSPVGCQNRSFALRSRSFDHFVGSGEDRWRHGQAEPLRCLEIDHQLEGGRVLDRQIGRLGALQDLAGVNADLAIDSERLAP